MGYYLQAPTNHNKAKHLLEKFGGTPIKHHEPWNQKVPTSLTEIRPDQALVCVVDNGMFEAAGVAYSDRELQAFNRPDDRRPKVWLILDNREAVYDAAGVAPEDR